MYLVSVVPISKSSAHKTLSYFSSTRIAAGTMVKVPLGNRVARAVVLTSRSALSAKSSIRKAAYALKKINKKDILEAGLSLQFLSAVNETATYYATTAGALLTRLLPKMLLEEPELWTPRFHKGKLGVQHKETLLLQMETEERFSQYRAMVRQCFARKTSVMFVVPTHIDAMRARAHLSQGIAEYVHVFSLKEKTEEAKRAWQKALSDTHPVLFITTSAGLSFERRDLATVIIERENSRAWRTLASPYINFKVFLEKLSRTTARQLVLGDSVLSIETLWNWKEKGADHGELSLVRWRLPAAPTTLIDVSAKPDQNGKFEIFSPELKNLIKKALEEGGQDSAPGKIFLLGVRRGLSPTTVCADCGYILPCLNCGAPVVLHEPRSDLKNSKGPTLERIYICHACGTKRESNTTCGYCGSWKLVPLGIGVEKIAAEARKLFPEANVLVLDKDHAPTEKKAQSIIKRFKDSGRILVGTELALFYAEKVPYGALVSADSLFSIPDFSINEKIFYLVSHLREMTEKEVIIQTRNIGKQVLAWAALGNIIDFYSNEIEERKALLYPPFSVFIKITILDLRFKIQDLRIRFEKWQPETYKNSLIIRIKRDDWPNQELLNQLALLGPRFAVKVDPESIL